MQGTTYLRALSVESALVMAHHGYGVGPPRHTVYVACALQGYVSTWLLLYP